MKNRLFSGRQDSAVGSGKMVISPLWTQGAFVLKLSRMNNIIKKRVNQTSSTNSIFSLQSLLLYLFGNMFNPLCGNPVYFSSPRLCNRLHRKHCQHSFLLVFRVCNVINEAVQLSNGPRGSSRLDGRGERGDKSPFACPKPYVMWTCS